MGRIKSALELALERTKNLTVDVEAVEAAKAKADGKRAAGKYLENPEVNDLVPIFASYPETRLSNMRKGVLEVLAANLQLPTREVQDELLERIGSGYAILAGSSGSPEAAQAEETVRQAFPQVTGIIKKYLDDMTKVEQMIKTQWAPKLREKERQMAARMGQDVRLDPMQDPEFSAFYKKNVDAVRQHYANAIEQAKEQLAEICGFEPEPV